MSWQSYVDDHLCMELPTGNRLKSAAIIGQDGNMWAQSAEFPELLPNEVENIMRGMVDAGTIAQNGLFLGGVKYMVIQGVPGEVIRGKKGPEGVTVKKTVSGLIFGIYADPTAAGEANLVVERLGDYLCEMGI